MLILVVEDDDVVRDALEAMIDLMGHERQSATTVQSALALTQTRLPDLIILDVTLPDGLGADFLRGFREIPRADAVPVIMLTSDTTLATKLEMFGLGVQDYVCKPFEMKELMARINVVTKRLAPKAITRIGDGEYDEVEKVLKRHDRAVSLTQNEDRLFRALLGSKDPVPKPELYRQIWGDRRVGPRNLDTLVNYLRKKIEPVGLEIKAVYGVGYLLEADPRAAAKAPGP